MTPVGKEFIESHSLYRLFLEKNILDCNILMQLTCFVGERKIQQDGREVPARSVRNPGRSLRGGADKKQASDGARFQGQRD